MNRIPWIAIAILISSSLIAAAIYFYPSTNRYEFKMSAGQLQRLDKLTGEMTFCNEGRCFKIDPAGTYVSPPEPLRESQTLTPEEQRRGEDLLENVFGPNESATKSDRPASR